MMQGAGSDAMMEWLNEPTLPSHVLQWHGHDHCWSALSRRGWTDAWHETADWLAEDEGRQG